MAMSDNSADAYRDSPTKVLSASLGLKAATLLGVPVAAYASGWLFLVPNHHYYDWPDELGMFFALACTTFLFSVCWGAVCAYIVRRLNWHPRRCGLPSLPLFVAFFVTFVLSFVFGRAHAALPPLIFFSLTAGSLANLFCRKFAYPAVDVKDIYPTWRSGPSFFQR